MPAQDYGGNRPLMSRESGIEKAPPKRGQFREKSLCGDIGRCLPKQADDVHVKGVSLDPTRHVTDCRCVIVAMKYLPKPYSDCHQNQGCGRQ